LETLGVFAVILCNAVAQLLERRWRICRENEQSRVRRFTGLGGAELCCRVGLKAAEGFNNDLCISAPVLARNLLLAGIEIAYVSVASTNTKRVYADALGTASRPRRQANRDQQALFLERDCGSILARPTRRNGARTMGVGDVELDLRWDRPIF
jgi:hypothetical protein